MNTLLNTLTVLNSGGSSWFQENIALVTAAIVAIATLLFTIFTKVIIGIYQQAVNFRSEFVTKEEFDKMRAEFKNDFALYKEETTKSIMIAAHETIRNKLTEFEDIKVLANDVRVDAATINYKMESFDTRINELTTIRNEMYRLTERLNSVTQQKSTTGLGVRRTE